MDWYIVQRRSMHCTLWINPLMPIGSTRYPSCQLVSAGLHATDTLWPACINFLTYSDDHPSWQSGLSLRGERSRSSSRGYKWTYQSFPAVLKLLRALKGLYVASSILLCNPLMSIGSPVIQVNWPMNWFDFAVPLAHLGWSAQNRHTVACMHQFSYILRWPPEPAVCFMSELRVIKIEHANCELPYRSFPAVLKLLQASKG